MPLRFLDAGESHGPELTAVLEGLPAGIDVSPEDLDRDLARRQRAYGAGPRMKLERDHGRITAGVLEGRTTGGPVAVIVKNLDHARWAGRDLAPMTVPRPGHADLTGSLKYRHPDLRYALERASARETAARVCVGALCRAYLRAFSIEIGGYTVSLGEAEIPLEPCSPEDYRGRFARAMASELACPEPLYEDKLRDEVSQCVRARDTLGGVCEVVALGLPPGLGSHVHWDRRLDGRVAQAVLSIQAMKGVEVGPAFANARLRGTQVQDPLYLRDGRVARTSNRAGGLEGGVTTGEPLVVRCAMKPLSSTLTPLPSVDLLSGESAPTVYERSDFSALPRAVPVCEAALALVLADALLEKLGGDSIAEQRPRFEALLRGSLGELPLRGTPWRFGYEPEEPR
ncbi:MAG: chorismate synthase [Deltaproteobacteria bacterium]|nr:chorismate synthase [Deltaproteobacteria bacterium]